MHHIYYAAMLKRALKHLLIILIILLALPYILVPIYVFVPPISLGILQDAASFKQIQWQWKPIGEISTTLRRTMIAAEDGKFCTHNGVDWDAVEDVVDDARRKDWKFKRGASTITMQISKNLFLWYYPSVVRKPMEIPLASWIDYVWTKRRTMEVYMNIAEMGDGIYGAEAAAQHYFKKPAEDLNLEEASRLTAILPSPIKRNPAKPSKYVQKYANSIAKKARQVSILCTK